MSYFYCEICGNLLDCKDEKSNTLMCCGQKMKKCEEHLEDELFEKHLPFIKKEDNVLCVKVGEVLHPSSYEHHIEFVELTTSSGKHLHTFKTDEKPECCFFLNDNEIPLSVRAYCNLHGMWRKDL